MAAIGLPMGLDAAATRVARAGLEQWAARRTRAHVTLGRVSLVGLFRVRLGDVAIRVRGQPLDGAAALGAGRGALRGATRRASARRVTLTVSAQALLRGAARLSEVAVTGAALHWEALDPVASLRRFARQVGGPRDPRGRPRAGARRTGAGVPSLRIELQQVTLVRRRDGCRVGRAAGRPGRESIGGPPWDLLVARGVRLERDARGFFSGAVRAAQVQVASGEGIRILQGVLRGRPRSGGGLRLAGGAVSRARLQCRGGRPCGPWVRVRADELAPDLLQVDVRDVRPTAPSRTRWHADLDLRSRTAVARGSLSAVSLGTAQRWLAGWGLARPWSSRSVGRDARVAVALGRLRLTPRQVTVKGVVQASNLTLNHAALSERPVRVGSVKAAGTLRFDRASGRLELREGAISRHGVTLRIRGAVGRVQGRLRGHATLSLPPTPCQRALEAIPRELVSSLQGMRLSGALSGRLTVRADRPALEELQVILRVPSRLCAVVADSPRADPRRLATAFAFTIQPLGWRPTRLEMGPARADWVPYRRIGRNVVAAFLAAEDRRFFAHQGFDLENIRRALVEDLRQGRFVKGASSISQQVVKNVFLTHRRTLARKLQEAVLTWRLEQVLSKQRILEIYLNLVEMGPGRFGVKAGAWHYFRKAPHSLNPLEAAHLAAVTPNPRGYFERFRSGRAGMDWLLHLRWLLYQMHALGWIDRATYQKYRVADLKLITDPAWRRAHRGAPDRVARKSGARPTQRPADPRVGPAATQGRSASRAPAPKGASAPAVAGRDAP